MFQQDTCMLVRPGWDLPAVRSATQPMSGNVCASYDETTCSYQLVAAMYEYKSGVVCTIQVVAEYVLEELHLIPEPIAFHPCKHSRTMYFYNFCNKLINYAQ